MDQVFMEGAEGFVRALVDSPEEARKVGKAGVKAAMKEGVAIAQAHVKVRSGHARESIHGSVRSTTTNITGRIGAKIPYGADLNYGENPGKVRKFKAGRRLPNGGRTKPYNVVSRGRKGQPFIDPTLHETGVLDRMTVDFEDGVEKMVEKLARA